MKCRARMINGQPVTFESKDWGKVPVDSSLDVYVTTFEGEGFSVCSEYRPLVSFEHNTDERIEADRRVLDRSGVDTSTAEYWEVHQDGLFTRVEQKKPGIISFECGRWVPLFPPVVKPPMPREFSPSRITYVGAENLVTAAMLEAGARCARTCTLAMHPEAIATVIWRAMEKARTK